MSREIIREEKLIHIKMSPVELRELAHRMDKAFEERIPGHSTQIAVIAYSDDVKICLHMDQDYYHKLQRAENPYANPYD